MLRPAHVLSARAADTIALPYSLLLVCARARSPQMVTKVYVGNLPKDDPIREDELRGVFSKFGDIVNTWIARKPAVRARSTPRVRGRLA